MSTIVLPPTFDVEATRVQLEKLRCERDLTYFIRKAWDIVEPGTPYVENWHIELISAHLEAVTNEEIVDGDIYNRLLINVPPGMMKSLLVNVFWPAWEWGPRNMPHLRYILISHNMDNPVRDNVKARRLITSEWYQKHWGDRVKLTSDQNVKTYFETTATGFRQAAASSGITGKRGDRIILDDPHTWESANSEQQRATTTEWFLGALPTRMNHPKKSAIIVIMQRLHEEDVSGVILEHGGKGLGYDHVMLPMRYDPLRGHAAPQGPIYTRLGYQDPRRDEGELIFPERFPQAYVDRLESTMGPYEVAGQHQQSPEPKGGGIIKDNWWQLWAAPEFPPMDYIIASLDTAYGVKQENDFSAITVWGVFSVGVTAQMSRAQDRYGRTQTVTRQYTEGAPQIMLMDAWQERLAFPDLVKRVIATCKTAKVDTLIIENKAAGISVAQELRRTLATEDFGVRLIDTKSLDKVARLYSVQHLFSEGMVWAPDKVYSEAVIRQTSSFPKGKHDDLVDTVAHALRHLRDIGVLTRSAERIHAIEQAMRHAGKPPGPLYPG